MKVCPKCKAELDDHARFCLYCMTSLDDKTKIPQPVRKRRLWPFVLAFSVFALCLTLIWRLAPLVQPSAELPEEPIAKGQIASTFPKPGESATIGTTTGTEPQQHTQSAIVAVPGTIPATQATAPTTPTTAITPSASTTPPAPSTPTTIPTTSSAKDEEENPTQPIKQYTWEYQGVTYIFQRGTEDGYIHKYPNMINPQHLVLVDVQGYSPSGYYNITGWVGNASVTGVASGAFDRISNASSVGLNFYICRIDANAFGRNTITTLYIEGPNTYIHPTNFACFSSSMTIYGNEDIRNGSTGERWTEIAKAYGYEFVSRDD